MNLAILINSGYYTVVIFILDFLVYFICYEFYYDEYDDFITNFKIFRFCYFIFN